MLCGRGNFDSVNRSFGAWERFIESFTRFIESFTRFIESFTWFILKLFSSDRGLGLADFFYNWRQQVVSAMVVGQLLQSAVLLLLVVCSFSVSHQEMCRRLVEKRFWIRIRSQIKILVLIWITSSICVVQNVFVRLGYFWSKKLNRFDPSRRVDFRNKKCNRTLKLVQKI